MSGDLTEVVVETGLAVTFFDSFLFSIFIFYTYIHLRKLLDNIFMKNSSSNYYHAWNFDIFIQNVTHHLNEIGFSYIFSY